MKISKLVALWTALSLLGAMPALSQTRPIAVLELFTSQGCSSCPPADRLFERYANRKDVVALTMPVDYWDYLGWKDTLASPDNSTRQRVYASVRGDGAVYTPQVVVNGAEHAVGSKRGTIDSIISEMKQTSLVIDVDVKKVGDHLEITVPDRPDGVGVKSATVWLAAVQPKADVDVRRGENRGSSLSYFNVVRDLSAIGMWTGSSRTYRVPLHAMDSTPGEKCAVLLQAGKGGRIIGASWYGH